MNGDFKILFSVYIHRRVKLDQVRITQDGKPTDYFALKCRSDYQVQDHYLHQESDVTENVNNNGFFRKYEYKRAYLGENYYLFRYEIPNSLLSLINEHRARRMSISLDKIKSIVYKLVLALHVLHKEQMLGRVFTVENIFFQEIDQQIVIKLMDFGNVTKMEEMDQELLPDEILQTKFCGLPLDMWLLGAIMYHLIKLSPINKTPDTTTSNTSNQGYIGARSGRYDVSITKLVERMLTHDHTKRITFSQLLMDTFFDGIGNREELFQTYSQLEPFVQPVNGNFAINNQSLAEPVPVPVQINDTLSDSQIRHQAFYSNFGPPNDGA